MDGLTASPAGTAAAGAPIAPEWARRAGWQPGFLSGYAGGRDEPRRAVYARVAPDGRAHVVLALIPADELSSEADLGRELTSREVASITYKTEPVLQGMGFGVEGFIAASVANADARRSANWTAELALDGGDYLRLELRRAPDERQLLRMRARMAGSA